MDEEEASRLLITEYGRLAQTYEDHVVPRNADLVGRLLELADVRPGERVLDLGCGPGNLAFAAARRVGRQGAVQGIDLAEGMIRVASMKAAKEGAGNIRFDVADCRDLPFPDGTFDVVASCLGVPVVGHPGCFAEARRVLRGGGRFAFCIGTGRGTGGEVGKAFRETLEELRPSEPAPEIQALLEARQAIQATGQPAMLQRPEETASYLRDTGFVDVRFVAEVHEVVFPSVEDYRRHQMAWGDNEHEWRAMSQRAREAFRRELTKRVASFLGTAGFSYTRGVLFYVATKGSS